MSGISQIKFLEDPERDPMAPLSVNVAAMLDKVSAGAVSFTWRAAAAGRCE